jgi:hypothetical protein
MIHLDEARFKMTHYLHKMDKGINSFGSGWGNQSDAVESIVTNVVEFELGWAFCYNNKKYIESGKVSHALAGNGPIIICKRTGKMFSTGTSQDVEYYIDEFINGRLQTEILA